MTVFKKYNEGTAEWEAIAVGLKGDKGDPGDPGGGLPTGGTAGQYIVKQSTTDFDTAWVTPTFVDAAGAVSAIKADADWNATDWDTAFSVTSGLGTISTQDANSVNIDGGAIDATDIGVTTPATVSSDNYLTADNYPTIKPSLNLDFANTKTLDPRVTFARASTATYYDGQTVAKAEENLFSQSQFNALSGYWSNSRSTLTQNDAAAPDGTTTALSFNQKAGETTSGLVASVDANVFTLPADDATISIFAKPNGKNWLILRELFSDGSAASTFFDVQNGVVGTTDSAHTASITAAANGYYRCSIQFTLNASRSSTVIFYLADADGSFTVADDTNGLYLWGAQLEQRDSVTAYTPTTTQPITNYIPVLQTASSGDPRFDHDPITGESKGLLIEEQRTNVQTYSEDFSNAAWEKQALIVDSNVVIAPDGTKSADKLIPSTAANFHYVRSNITGLPANTVYKFSFYAKKGELSVVYGLCPNILNFSVSAFIVTLGTTIGAFATNTHEGFVEDVGNGWYKISVSTITSGGGEFRVSLYPNATTSNSNSPGDDYSGLYIWGAQLEQASFPTSYIKTEGSQVTRVADSASMTGTNFSDWYRPDQGTVYAEAQNYDGNTNDPKVFAISDGTINNRIRIDINDGIQFRIVVSKNGNTEAIPVTSFTDYALPYKTVASYAVNDIKGYINGANPLTDTSALLPVVDRLNIGTDAAAAGFFNGTIKRLAYYRQRLPNATLQALTEE